jgi:hypothetical protein
MWSFPFFHVDSCGLFLIWLFSCRVSILEVSREGMSEEEVADLEARREKRKEAWAAAKIPYGASDAELDAMAGSIHQVVRASDPTIQRADVVSE